MFHYLKRYWILLFAITMLVLSLVIGVCSGPHAYGGEVARGDVVDVPESVGLSDVGRSQFAGSLEFTEVSQSGAFSDVPDNNLILIYQLFKFRFVNAVDSNSLADEYIAPTNALLNCLDKKIKTFDGYDYQDMAIDGEIITFRYVAKGSQGAANGQNQGSTIEQQILADTLPFGSAGRLYVPKLGVSIRLNLVNDGLQNENLINQYYAAEDCGAIFPYGVQRLIGDSMMQGFSLLRKLEIGDNIYIKKDNKTLEKFKCDDCKSGYKKGHFYYDEECLTHLNGKGITCYTFMDSARYNVLYRVFQPC